MGLRLMMALQSLLTFQTLITCSTSAKLPLSQSQIRRSDLSTSPSSKGSVQVAQNQFHTRSIRQFYADEKEKLTLVEYNNALRLASGAFKSVIEDFTLIQEMDMITHCSLTSINDLVQVDKVEDLKELKGYSPIEIYGSDTNSIEIFTTDGGNSDNQEEQKRIAIRYLKRTNDTKRKLRYYYEKFTSLQSREVGDSDIVNTVEISMSNELYLVMFYKYDTSISLQENIMKVNSSSQDIEDYWSKKFTQPKILETLERVSDAYTYEKNKFEVLRYNLNVVTTGKYMVHRGLIDENIFPVFVKECEVKEIESIDVVNRYNQVNINGKTYFYQKHISGGTFASVDKYKSRDRHSGLYKNYAIRRNFNYYSNRAGLMTLQDSQKIMKSTEDKIKDLLQKMEGVDDKKRAHLLPLLRKAKLKRRKFKLLHENIKANFEVPKNLVTYFYDKYIHKRMMSLMNSGTISTEFVTKIYDVGEIRINGEMQLFVIMEKMDGDTTDLYNVFQGKPLSEIQTVEILLQVAKGLHSIHGYSREIMKQYVHSDIKGANILYRLESDEMHHTKTHLSIKIADFGCVNQTKMNRTCRSRWIHPRETSNILDRKDDVYALAVFALTLVTQRQFTRLVVGTSPNDVDNLMNAYLGNGNLENGKGEKLYPGIPRASALWTYIRDKMLVAPKYRDHLPCSLLFLEQHLEYLKSPLENRWVRREQQWKQTCGNISRTNGPLSKQKVAGLLSKQKVTACKFKPCKPQMVMAPENLKRPEENKGSKMASSASSVSFRKRGQNQNRYLKGRRGRSSPWGKHFGMTNASKVSSATRLRKKVQTSRETHTSNKSLKMRHQRSRSLDKFDKVVVPKKHMTPEPGARRSAFQSVKPRRVKVPNRIRTEEMTSSASLSRLEQRLIKYTGGTGRERRHFGANDDLKGSSATRLWRKVQTLQKSHASENHLLTLKVGRQRSNSVSPKIHRKRSSSHDKTV